MHHLCGVPLLCEKGHAEWRGQSTPLEGFAGGLCFELSRPGVQREEFPSWSWTGWKGVVSGCFGAGIAFNQGFPIKVDILVPEDGSTNILSWDDFEARDPSGKASLPQSCRLSVTAAVVKVSPRQGDDEESWKAILYYGDEALEGSLNLCKDPVRNPQFGRRLVGENWVAIVAGNAPSRSGWATALLLLEESGNHWERVGLITTCFRPVEAYTGLERRTFLLG